MCLLRKTIFFLFFNVILLFIERISSLYDCIVDTRGKKLHKLKEKKLIFLYDLKKQ